jgi:HEAT repeat protein
LKRQFSGIVIVAMCALGAADMAAPDRRPLGEIDFFGYKGLDLGAVRAALPFHEGESFPPPKIHVDGLKKQVGDAVTRVIGRAPTDVAFVCCDAKQNYIVYIGLPGESYQALTFNAAPAGAVRLPKEAIKLSDRFGDAWAKAVLSGHSTEDDSAGYTLTNESKARSAELALRDYALLHEDLLFQVLSSSSDGEHRAIAAQMLGYGRQTDQQVDALVHASLDPDDGVRNNAARALEVLASAKPLVAQRIPLDVFMRLMRSGAWSDHNKASLVLVALTTTRDPRMLAQLRGEALDPLLEMARWRNIGHAEAALTVLGRMVGIEEDALNKLIDAGQTAIILGKFDR